MYHVVLTPGVEQSLEDALDFYEIKLRSEKLIEIKNTVLETVRLLSRTANHGQIEPTLEYLGLGHRRIIEDYFKIIYRIVDETVYVTDIFDSRMNPDKMKG